MPETTNRIIGLAVSHASTWKRSEYLSTNALIPISRLEADTPTRERIAQILIGRNGFTIDEISFVLKIGRRQSADLCECVQERTKLADVERLHGLRRTISNDPQAKNARKGRYRCRWFARLSVLGFTLGQNVDEDQHQITFGQDHPISVRRTGPFLGQTRVNGAFALPHQNKPFFEARNHLDGKLKRLTKVRVLHT